MLDGDVFIRAKKSGYQVLLRGDEIPFTEIYSERRSTKGSVDRKVKVLFHIGLILHQITVSERTSSAPSDQSTQKP